MFLLFYWETVWLFSRRVSRAAGEDAFSAEAGDGGGALSEGGAS